MTILKSYATVGLTLVITESFDEGFRSFSLDYTFEFLKEDTIGDIIDAMDQQKTLLSSAIPANCVVSAEGFTLNYHAPDSGGKI